MFNFNDDKCSKHYDMSVNPGLHEFARMVFSLIGNGVIAKTAAN